MFRFLLEQDELWLGCSFNSTVFSVVSPTHSLMAHQIWFYLLNWHLASTSDIFGTSLGSALVEPQNPITIRMFEIVLFPSTYQPPPYCCFLGKIRRRKFLDQVICPCVWCFSRLQSVPQTHPFPRSGWFSLTLAKSLHQWQDCSYLDQVMEAVSVSRSSTKASVLSGV